MNWIKINPLDESTLPALDQVVFLFDGKPWIGGRTDDGNGWLWANCYGTAWHNGKKWDGDMETDADYEPTHWMPFPEMPNEKGQR